MPIESGWYGKLPTHQERNIMLRCKMGYFLGIYVIYTKKTNVEDMKLSN